MPRFVKLGSTFCQIRSWSKWKELCAPVTMLFPNMMNTIAQIVRRDEVIVLGNEYDIHLDCRIMSRPCPTAMDAPANAKRAAVAFCLVKIMSAACLSMMRSVAYRELCR